MRKSLTMLVLAVLVVLGGVAWISRDRIGQWLFWASIKPRQSFEQTAPPPVPDYADDKNWAALPQTRDPADSVPDAALAPLQEQAQVDVFFVHPTTYFDKAAWNQPPEHALSRQLIDDFTLRGQAAVFNSCCQVYAPRYRQATLFAFADQEGNGPKALELVYGDVERAFDQFIAQRSADRPFILAGHSQGALHVWTLLQKRITGTPLRERLVAAYAVGFAFDRNELAMKMPDIGVCATPEQVGCLITWNAVGPQNKPWSDTANHVCVNPLSWAADSALVGHDRNLGGVTYGDEEKPTVEAGVADAQCANGLLQVTEIRSQRYDKRPLGRDNYHIYDYALFYRNVRENAVLRTQAYLAARNLTPKM